MISSCKSLTPNTNVEKKCIVSFSREIFQGQPIYKNDIKNKEIIDQTISPSGL